MVEFNFYLSDENTSKLFEIKDKQGYRNLTANEYARQIVEDEIWRLSRMIARADSVDDAE